MTHSFDLQVYYEDTDMAGIVYYANYLRFIERARSDWVRQLGIDQLKMKQDGVVFAVRRVEADYLAPAVFEDRLIVHTSVKHLTAARMVMSQSVARGDEVLFQADVTIVCIGSGGRPVKLPAELRSLLDNSPK